ARLSRQICADILPASPRRTSARRAVRDASRAAARRVVRERHDEVPELRLLVPTAARRADDETVIRKRLHEHFRKHAARLSRKRRRAVWISLTAAIAGFALMTASALLRHQPETITRTVLPVFLEPAGWFAV